MVLRFCIVLPLFFLTGTTFAQGVDLSGEEITAFGENSSTHVLASPWYRNIHISGFGAVSFFDLGADTAQPNGGFVIKDAALFVDAKAWEDISFFFEIQTNILLRDEDTSLRTGEVYAHFRNVLKKWGDNLLGVKIGRVDIPFGEEYLWTDSADNPMISHAVGFPWLWDEGIVLYGKLRGVGWVASVTDGTMERSVDDHPSKAFTAKIYGTPWKPLYLSSSFMRNGKTDMSALYLGDVCIQPVGTNVHGREVPSSLGASASEKVAANLYEIDATCRFSDAAELVLSLGHAFIDDADNAFDRKLTWFSVQPRYNLPKGIYIILRYSEFGTYDSDKGYLIDGGFLMDGRRTFGYDANRLQRFSAGAGWKLNPRTTIKLEAGRDRFEVIDGSPIDPSDDSRGFLGFELTQSF